MYIKKWWGEYFGGTDDSCSLMEYFAQDEKTEYSLAGILTDFNVNIQTPFNGFRATENIQFSVNELKCNINMAINLFLDLAVITLESLHSGSVPLTDLCEDCENEKQFVITADKNILGYLISILTDFCVNPLEYDLAEMCEDNEMREIVRQCKEVINELEKQEG